jgi:SAM-dependent methyltransferase
VVRDAGGEESRSTRGTKEGKASVNPWLDGPGSASRRAESDRTYQQTPDRFLGPPSTFAAWALERIHALHISARVLELGSGPGRDARFLAPSVHGVRAVDHSSVAIARARAQPENPENLRFENNDLFYALSRTDAESVDVVYAHDVYMLLSDSEVDTLARKVYRVLRPGGLHLFAVRSTTDPHLGEGREVAPDVWAPLPDSEPMHYYRRDTLERFTSYGMRRVAEELEPDRHEWYVCDTRAG